MSFGRVFVKFFFFFFFFFLSVDRLPYVHAYYLPVRIAMCLRLFISVLLTILKEFFCWKG